MHSTKYDYVIKDHVTISCNPQLRLSGFRHWIVSQFFQWVLYGLSSLLFWFSVQYMCEDLLEFLQRFRCTSERARNSLHKNWHCSVDWFRHKCTHIFFSTGIHGLSIFIYSLRGFLHLVTQKELLKYVLCFGFCIGAQLGGTGRVAGVYCK